MPFPNPDTQFKPGRSGNPLGKPRGRSVTARLRDLLDASEIGGKPLPNGKQVADLLAEVLLKNALKGDHRFVATVLDRVDGKVGDSVEHTGGVRVVVDYTDGDPADAAPAAFGPGADPAIEGEV